MFSHNYHSPTRYIFTQFDIVCVGSLASFGIFRNTAKKSINVLRETKSSMERIQTRVEDIRSMLSELSVNQLRGI